jgi:hypothetical protein
MTAPSQQSSTSAPRIGGGWLWSVRVVVVLSILTIAALVLVSSPSASDRGVALLLASVLSFPYLWILVRLRGKAWQKGLALSVVIAASIFLVGVLLPTTIDPCFSNPSSPSLSPLKGLFALLQVVLVPLAIKANYVLQRATHGGPALGREILKRALYVGLPLLVLGLIVLPNLVGSRIAALGISRVGHLRTIHTAEETYRATYKKGYSLTLKALSPPPNGAPASPTAAGLMDDVLASGQKAGYTYTYAAGPANSAGEITTYTVTAVPGNPACAEGRYFTDETGIIRQTLENRPATAQDAPIAE